MNPILIGAIALGVAVLGLIAHGWRFFRTRTISFATLWLIVPLAGAMIAFLVTPPNLLTLGLGGASLALAFVTLLAPIVVPVIVEEGTPQSSGSRSRDSRDRAA